MSVSFYLCVVIIVCTGTMTISAVCASVEHRRKLVRNIRMAELRIIDKLETQLQSNILDSVVDIITTELESAIRSE